MCEKDPKDLDWKGWEESVLYKTHMTLLFILKHLYSSDPHKIRTSYTLIHCQLTSIKKNWVLFLKKSFFWPRKTRSRRKIGPRSFFEGLRNNFLSDKTQFFLNISTDNGSKYNWSKYYKDLMSISVLK